MTTRQDYPVTAHTAFPWYRHRWPWILMTGPALVIAASLITIWLAMHSSDGLVTDDYYKQGLAINQTLKLSKRASEMGLQAGLIFDHDQISVRLSVVTATDFIMPHRIRITLSHPTRTGLDQSQWLIRRNDRYIGSIHLPRDGHRILLLEDEEQTWRIVGNIILPATSEILLGHVHATHR